MPIHIDPISQQRVVYQKLGDFDEFYSEDLEYDIIGGSEISTQVIPIISPTRAQQINLGRSNLLFGTDAELRGERIPDLGITGENKQTTNRIQIRRRMNV